MLSIAEMRWEVNFLSCDLFFRLEKGENVDPNKDFLKLDTDMKAPKEKVHLTTWELNGLKFIVMYLHHIPSNRKNVPVLLPDPIALIRVKVLWCYSVTVFLKLPTTFLCCWGLSG